MNPITLNIKNKVLEREYRKHLLGIVFKRQRMMSVSLIIGQFINLVYFLSSIMDSKVIDDQKTLKFTIYSAMIIVSSAINICVVQFSKSQKIFYVIPIHTIFIISVYIWGYVDDTLQEYLTEHGQDTFLQGFLTSILVMIYNQGTLFLFKILVICYQSFAIMYSQKNFHWLTLVYYLPIISVYIYSTYTRDKSYREFFLLQKKDNIWEQITQKFIQTSLIITKFNDREERIELYKANEIAQKQLKIKNTDDMREFCKKVKLFTKEQYLKINSQNKKSKKYEEEWQNTLDGHLRKRIDLEIEKQKNDSKTPNSNSHINNNSKNNFDKNKQKNFKQSSPQINIKKSPGKLGGIASLQQISNGQISSPVQKSPNNFQLNLQKVSNKHTNGQQNLSPPKFRSQRKSDMSHLYKPDQFQKRSLKKNLTQTFSYEPKSPTKNNSNQLSPKKINMRGSLNRQFTKNFSNNQKNNGQEVRKRAEAQQNNYQEDYFNVSDNKQFVGVYLNSQEEEVRFGVRFSVFSIQQTYSVIFVENENLKEKNMDLKKQLDFYQTFFQDQILRLLQKNVLQYDQLKKLFIEFKDNKLIQQCLYNTYYQKYMIYNQLEIMDIRKRLRKQKYVGLTYQNNDDQSQLQKTQKFQIKYIIDAIITIFNPQFKSKNIKVYVKCPLKYTDINSNELKFKQIIFNLMQNAYKFTPKNGYITIKITKDQQLKNCYRIRIRNAINELVDEPDFSYKSILNDQSNMYEYQRVKKFKFGLKLTSRLLQGIGPFDILNFKIIQTKYFQVGFSVYQNIDILKNPLLYLQELDEEQEDKGYESGDFNDSDSEENFEDWKKQFQSIKEKGDKIYNNKSVLLQSQNNTMQTLVTENNFTDTNLLQTENITNQSQNQIQTENNFTTHSYINLDIIEQSNEEDEEQSQIENFKNKKYNEKKVPYTNQIHKNTKNILSLKLNSENNLGTSENIQSQNKLKDSQEESNFQNESINEHQKQIISNNTNQLSNEMLYEQNVSQKQIQLNNQNEQQTQIILKK